MKKLCIIQINHLLCTRLVDVSEDAAIAAVLKPLN